MAGFWRPRHGVSFAHSHDLPEARKAVTPCLKSTMALTSAFPSLQPHRYYIYIYNIFHTPSGVFLRWTALPPTSSGC